MSWRYVPVTYFFISTKCSLAMVLEKKDPPLAITTLSVFGEIWVTAQLALCLYSWHRPAVNPDTGTDLSQAANPSQILCWDKEILHWRHLVFFMWPKPFVTIKKNQFINFSLYELHACLALSAFADTLHCSHPNTRSVSLLADRAPIPQAGKEIRDSAAWFCKHCVY